MPPTPSIKLLNRIAYKFFHNEEALNPPQYLIEKYYNQATKR